MYAQSGIIARWVVICPLIVQRAHTKTRLARVIVRRVWQVGGVIEYIRDYNIINIDSMILI